MNAFRILSVLAGAVIATTSVQAGASKLLIVGNVESVDIPAESITVQGKSIRTDDARRVLPGQFVNVYGVINADGTISNYFIESAPSYATDVAAANTLVSVAEQPNAPTISNSVKAERVIGTGVKAERVIGTGVKAERVIGTGVQAQRVIGTGVQAERVIGTGKSVE